MRPHLVVGSGISGLSAAVFLARSNRKVHLWEKDQNFGGMLSPISFQGILCDRGSHRVHPESHPLLRELTKEESWISQPRNGILILGGKHISYPPKPRDFLRGLGMKTSLSMAWGFLTRPNRFRSFQSWENDRSRIPHHDAGFESFVVNRVGWSAYNEFYRPYVEKVWGLDPTEISQTVAKQRVSTSNPLSTLRKSLRKSDSNVRTFLYPKKGLGSLIENLRQLAISSGVEIHSDQQFDALTNVDSYESVLYSGHLDNIAPGFALEHRGLYILHLAFPKGTVGSHDTWYTPERAYWFGRVSQPSRFSDELASHSHDILCVEIPEGQWGTNQDFTHSLPMIAQQLFDAGILNSHVLPDEATQTWIPKVYPMYRRGWYQRWKQALEKVASMKSVFPIGRQGLFLHCNMDHCVHISWEAVQNAITEEDSSSWITRCSDFLDLRVRD